MALNRFAIQAPANPVLIAPTPEMKNDPQGVVVISAENGGFEQPLPLVPKKNLGETVAILNRFSCLFAQHLHILDHFRPFVSARIFAHLILLSF